MTTPAIKFKITDAGRAAIVTPPTGIVAAFAYLAVGMGLPGNAGKGLGYQPTGHETALKAEFMRVPLGAGSKPASDQIQFAATIDGDMTGWINEIGLFLQDGTLFALWSEDPTVIQSVDEEGHATYGAPLGYKAQGIPITIGALIVVQGFDISALPIVVNGAPITLIVNRVEAHLADLLALVIDRARALRNVETISRTAMARIVDLDRRMAAAEQKLGD
ncbi:MAG: phage tail protein [Rhodoblastus sp.]